MAMSGTYLPSLELRCKTYRPAMKIDGRDTTRSSCARAHAVPARAVDDQQVDLGVGAEPGSPWDIGYAVGAGFE